MKRLLLALLFLLLLAGCTKPEAPPEIVIKTGEVTFTSTISYDYAHRHAVVINTIHYYEKAKCIIKTCYK